MDLTDEQMVNLIQQLAHSTASLHALHHRFDKMEARLAASEITRQRESDALEERLREVERWQWKMTGAMTLVGLGSGYIGAVLGRL